MPALPLIPFNKPPLSLPDQIRLLVSRGLTVNNTAYATHYLTHIGYYRLSGYTLPFQIGGSGPDRHDFKPGVTFEDILDRYVFDRKLRLLVMDAVERIEISVRAAMSNAIAARHGAHWYLNPRLFSPTFDHNRFIEDIRQQIGHASTNNRRRDIYIEHYYQTYSTPDMPPSWMVFESVSFGTISVAYMNLAHPEFVSVCGSYGLPHPVLISWLHSLNYIRNICAHHSRLWNRECRIKPMIARAFKSDLTPNDRVYAQLAVMQILLAKIAPGNHWTQKLRDLLAEHPAIPLVSMGFPANWASRKIWGMET
ncbi:MAG TPA: Abi family protein [Rhodopila sp.]|nr:Abi family protein [Rhodopila sp.]